MARYATILGEESRHELLFFFHEPVRRLGHALATLVDDEGALRAEHAAVGTELHARARRAFRFLPGGESGSTGTETPGVTSLIRRRPDWTEPTCSGVAAYVLRLGAGRGAAVAMPLRAPAQDTPVMQAAPRPPASDLAAARSGVGALFRFACRRSTTAKPARSNIRTRALVGGGRRDTPAARVSAGYASSSVAPWSRA